MSCLKVYHYYVKMMCFFHPQFQCFFSQLSLYGSWYNKNGDRLTYFSGDEGENVCSCGQADPNECYKRPHETQERNCNCDSNQPVTLNDSGVITNKVSLNNLSIKYSIHYLTTLFTIVFSA